MKSRCLLNSCKSTSQFISIMFRCSFFFQNKELPFSSVGEPLHDHGYIFARPSLFKRPIFHDPSLFWASKICDPPSVPTISPLLISGKSLSKPGIVPSFAEQVNLHHPTMKFTAEKSENETIYSIHQGTRFNEKWEKAILHVKTPFKRKPYSIYIFTSYHPPIVN